VIVLRSTVRQSMHTLARCGGGGNKKTGGRRGKPPVFLCAPTAVTQGTGSSRGDF